MIEKKLLALANKELAFQNEEKEKRAAELLLANIELQHQNEEKEKRAAELVIANIELQHQNEEKEKRAAELVIANIELQHQNEEKEKRAAELLIANEELLFQNSEKENRAAELLVANEELAYQNIEKEKRAAELVLANIELAFQNAEKEKRAAELTIANKELESFTFISSHDLQEPLRKIQSFSNIILTKESETLSANGKMYFDRIQGAALHMQHLIDDLMAYSRISNSKNKFVETDLTQLVEEAKEPFVMEIEEKKAIIESDKLGKVKVIHYQFLQLLRNLIGNSLKFAKEGKAPHIKINTRYVTLDNPEDEILPSRREYCRITFNDNGIGFEPEFKERIFEIFQKLHGKSAYAGTGIGLTIVKKIVENHNGIITVDSEVNVGTTFDIYIPVIGL